jgi:hypothetical protein
VRGSSEEKIRFVKFFYLKFFAKINHNRFATSLIFSWLKALFKFSPVGGDTNRGGPPWAVSPPTTISTAKRQFEMHQSLNGYDLSK